MSMFNDSCMYDGYNMARWAREESEKENERVKKQLADTRLELKTLETHHDLLADYVIGMDNRISEFFRLMDDDLK